MSVQVANRPGRWLDFASNDHPASWYQAVKTSGIVGVVLDLMSPGWTAAYHNAMAAGLAVMLFQGYYAPDWVITADAAQRADYAVSQAESVGYPKGAVLWLDWEAVPPAVTAAEALTWINRWTQVVQSVGY
ncbi:MAG: glycoside hydrolase domain-containing protein, partial [Sulfobacillus sp.]